MGDEAPGRGAGGAEAGVESKAEMKVRQLGLAVGLPGAVAAVKMWILGVDGPAHVVGGARHGHHPGCGRSQQDGEQAGGQGVVAEVINAELHLEPVGGATKWKGHDTGIVDQKVDSGVMGRDGGRGGGYGLQGRQVQVDHLEGGARGRPANLGLGGRRLDLIPGGHHHVGACGGEGASGL